jgi:hypothetical protein
LLFLRFGVKHARSEAMSNVSTKPIDGNFRAPEKARAKPKRIAAKKSGHPKPQWASVFESNLGDVPGYAYAVAHHGHVVDEGASGFARSAIDAANALDHSNAH